MVEQNGEPWFVAKDVAMALGYASTNMPTVFQAVPEEWKGSNRITTLGGEQDVLTISEQGLYFFLGRSDKPAALPYQKWIAGEVVPSIRRTGGYLATKQDDTPEAIMARAVLVAQDTLKRLEYEKATLQAKVNNDAPKVLFADSVEASYTSILIGDLAKLICQNGLKIGQNKLFGALREQGFLMKHGERRNMPTQTALERGLFEVKERTINNPDGSIRITRTTKVTGKGQVFFVNKFLK